MRLTREAIVGAGAHVAAHTDIDSVGVRSVAHELGVTPMALYRHVGDASSLQRAVVDRLLADFPAIRGGGTWEKRARTWAFGARDVLVRAPGLARHVLLHWLELPPILVALDGLAEMIDREGAGVDAVAAANALFMHVLMRAQAEESIRESGAARDLTTLRSLRSEVPFLWRNRDEYRIARLDEHFTFGLDALLHGFTGTKRSRRAHS